MWDVRANGCRFSLKKTEDSINSMIAIDNSSNQPTLACASGDGTLTIIDLSTKKMVIQVSKKCILYCYFHLSDKL